MINETMLKKFINNCPKCGKGLKPYAPLPGLPPANAYCPNCDILRVHSSAIPFLCEDCNSRNYYNEDRDKASQIDRLITNKITKLYDKDSLFTKGWILRKDVSEEERKNILEEIGKLQEQRPKDVCWYCGCTKFVRIKTDKLYEMDKKGELKIGYKISLNFTPVTHDCRKSADTLTRIAKTTYKAICECGYEEYVLVPEWQQDEMKEIRIMKEGHDNIDEITLEDLEMTQKIPIITFKDDKDLLKKIKKEISKYENT